MDYLAAQRRCDRFVVIGLCSGAYQAFHTGLLDPRVAAQVLLNPQTFAWKEGAWVDVDGKLRYKSFRYYLAQAQKRSTWVRLLDGQVHWRQILPALGARALRRAGGALSERLATLWNKTRPEPSVLAQFRALLQRKVQIFLLYSQEDPGLDELALHLGKDASRLRGDPRFHLELIAGPDHTFTPLWSQRRLEERITAYLSQLGAGL
jgi:dienelactone hydrolase